MFFEIYTSRFLLMVSDFASDRSSHRRCSVRKGVLRNFSTSTGKHLCQIPYFNKVSGLRPATLLKKRLWHRRTLFFIAHLGGCFWSALKKRFATIPFTETHRSSLEKVDYILTRSITKFYNSDEVNATMAGLYQTKTRQISL